MSRNAVLNLGFRSFFLGAALFAVVTMVLWMSVYVIGQSPSIVGISILQWHAHEMLYGFTMAVIAGFLLTAVKNWTGIQTPHGFSLLGLVLLWMLPRILFLFGTALIEVAAVVDLLFMIGLIGAIADPIIKAKQWKQLGIVLILVLLLGTNSLFYLGAVSVIDQGVWLGIYGGLFLIMGLILMIGRRVIPFFIETGVGYPVKLVNREWLDRTIIVLYLAFLIAELALHQRELTGLTALGLGIANSVRLSGWYTSGIWKKTLLWSLYVAFLFINLGFFLLACNVMLNLPSILFIHAFSVGGIGIITLSMMARVTLGHTGRNVQNPPRAVSLFLGLMVAAAIVRVLLPLLVADYYVVWIALSQILWIAAFCIFLVTYFSLLVKPRVDGQFG